MQVDERSGVTHLDGKRELRPPGHRPVALWPLLVVLVFLSIGAFVGGISFIADPTGAGLGVKLAWLEQTPVNDYFLPGLFLVIVYAIGSLLLTAGLAWRLSPGPLAALDRRLGFHWAWAGTIAVGAVLIGWILYEFTVIPQVIALQPILIGVGILMVTIPFLPSMRRHYRSDSTRDIANRSSSIHGR